MIKFLKQKFETIRYRRILKYYFEPRKDFLKESKILFIQKLKNEGIVTKKEFIRIPLYTRVFRYSLASILLILMLGGGSIIFAEKQNVNPDHPLYEFKKLGESIQIKLAAEEEKPLLHKEFAERRLEEIKQLKVELQETQQKEVQDNENGKEALNRRQTIINNLEEDFEGEVDAILEKVETPKEPTAEPQQESAPEPEIKSKEAEESKNLCQSVSEIIERHREITPGNGEKWREFNEKCHRFFEQRNEQENTDNDSKNNSFWQNNNEN